MLPIFAVGWFDKDVYYQDTLHNNPELYQEVPLALLATRFFTCSIVCDFDFASSLALALPLSYGFGPGLALPCLTYPNL